MLYKFKAPRGPLFNTHDHLFALTVFSLPATVKTNSYSISSVRLEIRSFRKSCKIYTSILQLYIIYISIFINDCSKGGWHYVYGSLCLSSCLTVMREATGWPAGWSFRKWSLQYIYEAAWGHFVLVDSLPTCCYYCNNVYRSLLLFMDEMGCDGYRSPSF